MEELFARVEQMEYQVDLLDDNIQVYYTGSGRPSRELIPQVQDIMREIQSKSPEIKLFIRSQAQQFITRVNELGGNIELWKNGVFYVRNINDKNELWELMTIIKRCQRVVYQLIGGNERECKTVIFTDCAAG